MGADAGYLYCILPRLTWKARLRQNQKHLVAAATAVMVMAVAAVVEAVVAVAMAIWAACDGVWWNEKRQRSR